MRGSNLRLAIAVLASVSGLVLTAARTEVRGQFRAGVSVVPVPVSVHGTDGRILTGLTAGDFEVYDDGVRRPLVLFSDQVSPLTLLTLIDVSPSMAGRLKLMRQFAGALASAFSQGDTMRLGTFGGEFAISPVRTSDPAVLRRILAEELWIGSGSPLWSSLDRGLRVLAREEGRRALVIVSDGQASGPDGRSREDVVTAVHEASVLIYAVGFRSGGLSEAIRQVATGTGGGWTVLAPDTDFAVAVAQTLQQLRHNYLVGFEPATHDGQLHRVAVKVSVPGATVRARTHYVATKR